MNKQELAEQILKNCPDWAFSNDGLFINKQYAIAAIVEAMGVQQESEHNPNLHNLDVAHTGVCMKCGGTNLIDAPSPAPAKAVEAMPDSEVLKLMKDIPSEPLPVRWVEDEDMNQNYMAGFFTAFRYREAMDSLPAQKGMVWKYIGEHFPAIGENVIGYRPLAHTYGDPAITVLKYEGRHNVDLNGYSHGFERSHHVTHWMPLPEPPSESASSSNEDSLQKLKELNSYLLSGLDIRVGSYQHKIIQDYVPSNSNTDDTSLAPSTTDENTEGCL